MLNKSMLKTFSIYLLYVDQTVLMICYCNIYLVYVINYLWRFICAWGVSAMITLYGQLYCNCGRNESMLWISKLWQCDYLPGQFHISWIAGTVNWQFHELDMFLVCLYVIRLSETLSEITPAYSLCCPKKWFGYFHTSNIFVY